LFFGWVSVGRSRLRDEWVPRGLRVEIQRRGGFRDGRFGRGRDFRLELGGHRGRAFNSAAPQFEKTLVGAEVLTVAERVVSVKEVQRAGLVCEGAEREGCAGRLVFVAPNSLGLFADLVVDGGFFQCPKAELTPLGYGHFLYEGMFHGGLGLEFAVDLGQKFQKTLLGFALQDNTFGEQAVSCGIARGIPLAFGRDRPAGFGSVGTGGLDLTFSSHFDLVIARDAGISADFGGDLLISEEI
jgi:hypothetical protein